MPDHRGRAHRFLALLARYGVAAVWIFHGLFSKVLMGIPRHQRIVARILGEAWSAPATLVIGVAEVLLGLWVLSARGRRFCACTQTAALVAMNTLEILYARDLLLAPAAMVAANVLLLSLAWYGALVSKAEA